MTMPARVIEVARDHLLDRGLLEFSLRALARDLGMTAPALYRYFPNRTALLEEIAERSFDLLDARLMEALAGSGPHDRLARAAHGYLRFGLDHPRDFALLALLPGAFGSLPLSEGLRGREAATFQFWTDRVREAMEAGVLVAGPPEEVAAALRSMAHGLISLHLRGTLEAADRPAFEALFWASGIRLMEGLAGPLWNRAALPDVVMDALRAADEEPPADREEGSEEGSKV